MWLNLFVNSLIPPSFPQTQSVLDVPPIPLLNPSQVIDRSGRSGESGLFQAFTSYLSSYAADDPPEPSEEELESTLCTVDCISACSVDAVFSNIMYVRSSYLENLYADPARQMPPNALQSLLSALLAQLPEESSPVVIVVKPALPAHSTTKPNGHRVSSNSPGYDPSMVYVLELATIIALRDQETIRTLGKDVVEALHNAIRNAASSHPLIVSRAVFYLLHILAVSHVSIFLFAFHTISLRL